jgi:hypoxanthine-DNA glycosylase
MNTINGFPPVADINASILILGSMPSTRSLQAQEYYAHPRNSFWFIISTLLGNDSQPDYNHRKTLLINNRIALWDVLNTCQREGSLDSAIMNESTVVNDFNQFFRDHPLIKAVYFNGSRAQQEYNRQVLPELDSDLADIEYQRLPSTSPAMASLTREQKLQEWAVILQHL